MSSSIRFSLAILVCLSACGCQTMHHPAERSDQEALDAVGSVTGALTGKDLSDSEKRKVLQDLQKDKDAQSAMRSISGALDVRQSGIKYCPIDGQRFSADVEFCPQHHVKLKELTD